MAALSSGGGHSSLLFVGGPIDCAVGSGGGLAIGRCDGI